jgi:membrane complex biogenesis BtpA family protein
MSASRQGIDTIWGGDRPVLIGMVHLLPLPGSPRWGGSMDAVVARATGDAEALAASGFDGILVENFLDAPFHAESVPAETVAGLTRAVVAVRDVVDLPIGVNVLRNDAHSALAVAAATGARFVRVNVHTGSMWTDQGLIHGQAANTMRLRAVLSPEIAVIADLHVKHGSPPAGSDLTSVAADTWYRGLADALIVSGPTTGAPVDPADARVVRTTVPGAPVLVGSGVTPENARRLLADVDGAIVGSALMRGGRAGEPIDAGRARALVAAAS